MSLFRSSSDSHHESDRPSATPAEAGVHGSSVSFSEAFLNTSSARNTLPEQYRTHFDELRSGILAFCHEFGISTSTLSNKEAFGKQLTSKRIPADKIAEAAFLFERLEHLLTNKEPFKETLPEHLREVERLYHLSEQYTFQVNLLKEAGILNERNAILGIDGKEYPIPTLEQIASRLLERKSELSVKRDQGFIKLLLVPFGMSLDALQEILKQFLLDYEQTHPDFYLNTRDPLFTQEDAYKGADTEDPPKMVYHPKSFDPHNHQGQTKIEILEKQAVTPNSFPGWTIHLFQPSNIQDLKQNTPKGIALVPRKGKGQTQGEKTPRPSLEACQSSIDYLSLLQKAQDNPSSPYFQEFGMTPEDWILAFMIHLEETGKPLDNLDDPTKTQSITYLTGAFFPSIAGSAFVPLAHWCRDARQAMLGRQDPRIRVLRLGARSSVIV